MHEVQVLMVGVEKSSTLWHENRIELWSREAFIEEYPSARLGH